MRLRGLLIGLACTFAAATLCHSASAQEASLDQEFIQFLDQERAKGPGGAGVIFIGSAIFGTHCTGFETHVGRVANGKYEHVTSIYGFQVFLGDPRYFKPVRLPAGEYVVGRAKCNTGMGGPGSKGMIFNGPHAKFHVRPGEFVTLGTLRIDYEQGPMFSGTGRTRRSVEDFLPRQTEEVKRRAPLLMKRLVKRHMTLIGPTEGQLRPPGLL